MISPAFSPEQRQAALAELECVIARLNRIRAKQLITISRLATVRQPTTRILALLRSTEKHLTRLYEIRRALLAQGPSLDLSEDIR